VAGAVARVVVAVAPGVVGAVARVVVAVAPGVAGADPAAVDGADERLP